MSLNSLILVDAQRAAQFALIGHRRRLFCGYTFCPDGEGVDWGVVRVGDQVFAVTALGAGWVFDPYASQARAEQLACQRQVLHQSDLTARRRAVDQAVKRIRPGRQAERLLWAIHERVLGAAASVVRIPDYVLAQAVWGSYRSAWPRHWRQELTAVLQGLTWLHVTTSPPTEHPRFGAGTALLVHAADLRGSDDDACDADCPADGGTAHHHYVINIGRGFLGILERLARPEDDSGVRTYTFARGRDAEGARALKRLGKTGRLVTCYLPAKLGEPDRCGLLTPRQHGLLQAILRETTRAAFDRRLLTCPVEVQPGNQIPDVQGRKIYDCPLLETTGRYVGFNGNKKRKGLGYCLLTPGGWLAKASYSPSELKGFLQDLAVLEKQLGLQVVGVDRAPGTFHGLEKLQAFAGVLSGHSTLNRVHLRLYAPADYLERWGRFFQIPRLSTPAELPNADASAELVLGMHRQGITRAGLAKGLAIDPSFLSKMLNGKKAWPAGLLAKAESWIAAQDGNAAATKPSAPGRRVVPSPPLPSEQAPLLEQANALLARGWSVVPQVAGAKKPCVRWKRFQTVAPTQEDWIEWARQFPTAGFALVLGSVSGLLVVDVDGPEAYAVLINRLGAEPVAPKALSGSRQPHRFHLFFRHPALTTKAKATPWHPNLEFRGQGGIVVIPPSMHKSGQPYIWVPGQSPDDLDFPELPSPILAALQPMKPARSAITPAPVPGTLAASASTRAFLSGRWANGPGWNERLFRAACDLQGRGLPQEEAEPLLLAGAQPWDRSEDENARRTITSAYRQPREPSQC